MLGNFDMAVDWLRLKGDTNIPYLISPRELLVSSVKACWEYSL